MERVQILHLHGQCLGIFCSENYTATPAMSPEPHFQTFNQNTGWTRVTVPSVFDCCKRTTEATIMSYTPKQGEGLANCPIVTSSGFFKHKFGFA